ncbi:MAG: tripartite tricarboxylate transporter TctB family protein [Alphaproteobacteria bacterium]|jgi:putative tricarboxylic transport membrane protein
MPKGLRDIVAALGLLIFSGLYVWATTHIPDRTIPNTPGPSFFPFVIITVVAALSVALLVKGYKDYRAENGVPFSILMPPLPCLMLGAFLIFLVALPWAGFLLSSIGFFAVLMVLYGSREPVKILLWSLALPSALYAVFTQLFQILLPTGPLGF